jgi:hypothetical protein
VRERVRLVYREEEQLTASKRFTAPAAAAEQPRALVGVGLFAAARLRAARQAAGGRRIVRHRRCAPASPSATSCACWAAEQANRRTAGRGAARAATI